MQLGEQLCPSQGGGCGQVRAGAVRGQGRTQLWIPAWELCVPGMAPLLWLPTCSLCGPDWPRLEVPVPRPTLVCTSSTSFRRSAFQSCSHVSGGPAYPHCPPTATTGLPRIFPAELPLESAEAKGLGLCEWCCCLSCGCWAPLKEWARVGGASAPPAVGTCPSAPKGLA